MQARRTLARRNILSTAEKAAVCFQAGDIESARFDSGTFDTVLCCNALQYFPDMPSVLAAVRTWLRPGGCLVFNVTQATKTVRLPSAWLAWWPEMPSTRMHRAKVWTGTGFSNLAAGANTCHHTVAVPTIRG